MLWKLFAVNGRITKSGLKDPFEEPWAEVDRTGIESQKVD